MTDGVEEAVNTSVLQNSGSVGGFQFFVTEIFPRNDSDGVEDVGRVNAVAGTRVTKVNGLAFHVFHGLDVGVIGSNESHSFRSQSENSAEFFNGFAFPSPFAVVGHVLCIGLSDTEVQILRVDGVDVELRASGRFYGSTNTVLIFLSVHDLGNSAACRVVNTGDAAGTDRDEFCFSESSSACHSERSCNCKGDEFFDEHESLRLRFICVTSAFAAQLMAFIAADKVSIFLLANLGKALRFSCHFHVCKTRANFCSNKTAQEP